MKIAHTIPIILSCATIALAANAVHAVIADRVKPVIPFKVTAFNSDQVRLLDGPFQHAQELDHKYLLSLNADQLLYNFRVNAKIKTTAKPLGGWESPDSEVRGHFTGHYLTACARMYASTGDKRLKRTAYYMVDEMAKCQKALGGKYLAAFPISFLDRVDAVQQVWAPYYTVHKILAGLLDVYTLCGDDQALLVARNMGDWLVLRYTSISDTQMQAMLQQEHGGMNEVLANLYALTGDKKYLTLSQRFNHHIVMDPLSKHNDILTGLHANTQIPKFIGAAREFELTGDPWLHEAASYFWDVVTKERSYVIGGHSDNEGFTPKQKLSEAFGPNTTETCNTYNMLKLTSHLFTWDPKPEYADYYERAVYNHILASQNPETGMMVYYLPLKPGMKKVFNEPTTSFWCCTGTGVENHARYNESIYFRDGTKTLYVNLFVASTLRWQDKGMELRQQTRYPEEEGTTLVLSCAKPTKLNIMVRHPYWATAGYTIKVNGVEVTDSSKPASFASLDREWRDGDRIEVAMPMTLRYEAFRDNPNRIAFMYGPTVLCAAVDPAKSIPVILSDQPSIIPNIRSVIDQPLTFAGGSSIFRSPDSSVSPGVTLIPLYKMYKSSYTVYWDVYTQKLWDAKQVDIRAELARRKELDARSVDIVYPGNEQNERDHKQTGVNTNTGPLQDKKWRDANNGWFSYEVKLLADTPQELRCTFWGSDAGRLFDIVVDGIVIATQKLENNVPDKFFDVTFALPTELINGKQKVTVRFQPHNGGFAGGLFELRVLKTAKP